MQVRGWDVATKKALVANSPAKTVSAELAGTSPAQLAQAFGNPVFVSADVPYRSQSEVDAAAAAMAPVESSMSVTTKSQLSGAERYSATSNVASVVFIAGRRAKKSASSGDASLSAFSIPYALV